LSKSQIQDLPKENPISYNRLDYPKVWSKEGVFDSDDKTLIVVGGDTDYTIDRYSQPNILQELNGLGTVWGEVKPRKSNKWEDDFHRIQKNIKDGLYEKSVLDYTYTVKDHLHPNHIFGGLIKQFNIEPDNTKDQILHDKVVNNTTPFYIEFTPEEVLFGMTPEQVIHKRGNDITIEILGGTKLKKERWSEEKIHEHEVIVDELIERLKQKVSNIHYSTNHTKYVGYTHHLQSNIKFTFGGTHDELIRLIHPTLAIKGDYNDRGYFGGLWGWEENNNMDLYLSIRCGYYKDRTYQFRVGCGITKYSNIKEEWKEVKTKLKWITNT
jgi:isochorismate synthase EntC